MNTKLNTRLISTGTLGLAGLVTAGLVGFAMPAATADEDTERRDVPDRELVLKRDDDTPDVVTTVDDDDDDDTNSRSRDRTGNSRSRADNTNSRKTAVSRDRDRSRRDLTRDRTRDGAGGVKRDWSKNRTNDRSRHDTRR